MDGQGNPKQILLKYNGVVVIQSLPDNELQTGTELYDAIVSRRCTLAGKAAYFYNPSTKVDDQMPGRRIGKVPDVLF